MLYKFSSKYTTAEFFKFKQRQGLSHHPTTYPAGSEKHAFQIVAVDSLEDQVKLRQSTPIKMRSLCQQKPLINQPHHNDLI